MAITQISGVSLPDQHKAYIIDLGDPTINISTFYSLLDTLSTHQELGLDTEWKPVFNGRPIKQALLQLSSNHLTLLIQILSTRRLTQKLCQILENPQIKKYGCGVNDDIRLLNRRFGISIASAVDLDALADITDVPKKVCGTTNSGEIKYGQRGLIHLYNLVFDTNFPKKDKKITMSNWASPSLTQAQIQYAVQDSFMSYQIGHKLSGL